MAKTQPQNVTDALHLLDAHFAAFEAAKPYADATGHTVPSDTKSWSQILVSTLTGIRGLMRKKGADLADGSDVKGANVWSAIDTPRFNGCLPLGRKSTKSKKPPDVPALDCCPYLFFVLWDEMGPKRLPRCRVWVVRSKSDPIFRDICSKWYDNVKTGRITSTNFQLHPPRNRDDNVVTNTCGNLSFPLYFAAVRKGHYFVATHYDPNVLRSGKCAKA